MFPIDIETKSKLWSTQEKLTNGKFANPYWQAIGDSFTLALHMLTLFRWCDSELLRHYGLWPHSYIAAGGIFGKLIHI